MAVNIKYCKLYNLLSVSNSDISLLKNKFLKSYGIDVSRGI